MVWERYLSEGIPAIQSKKAFSFKSAGKVSILYQCVLLNRQQFSRRKVFVSLEGVILGGNTGLRRAFEVIFSCGSSMR